MSWPYGLNPESFIVLVPRQPTVAELQAALDRQTFVSRLVLDQAEPSEVPSDTPPLYEWRGLLDGRRVAFRIGVADPSRLPGGASAIPGVGEWPVVLWSTRSGQPEVVGAGAMALYSWAVSTEGASVVAWSRTLHRTPDGKEYIDFVLGCVAPDRDAGDAIPAAGGGTKATTPIEIVTTVHR